MTQNAKTKKIIATNRKAYRDFTVAETWECGIILNGGEVKSLRAGAADLKGSFCRIDKGELFLYNSHINPYMEASYMNDEPDRVRKLLLHKKEIVKIAQLVQQKSMTILPTKMYFNKRGLVKVEIAAGRGKKAFDKREDIKKRTIDRALKQTLKVSRR